MSISIQLNPFRRWHLGYGTCSWRGYRIAGPWQFSLLVTDFYGPWMTIVLGRRCWTFRGNS